MLRPVNKTDYMQQGITYVWYPNATSSGSCYQVQIRSHQGAFETSSSKIEVTSNNLHCRLLCFFTGVCVFCSLWFFYEFLIVWLNACSSVCILR